MADTLKTIEDWERLDEYRMATAVAEIQKSENLRFFIRSVLSQTGVTGTPFGADPHSMAQAVGRHSIGSDLMATLMIHQPTLCGELIVEDAQEAMARDRIKPKENPDEY